MNSQSALQGIPENVTIADLSRYIVQPTANMICL